MRIEDHHQFSKLDHRSRPLPFLRRHQGRQVKSLNCGARPAASGKDASQGIFGAHFQGEFNAQRQLLDVRAEYDRAVDQARWSAFVQQHHDRAVKQVLAEQTARDPGFGQKSWGGRMAVKILAQKRLQEAFRRGRG